jgi:2'-5' RNA ligase
VPVRIDRIGHFARSRVLWCGPARPGPELQDLADRLEQALRHQGLAPETRPFKPHVTLARKVRHPPPRAAASWGDPIQWTAPELILAAGRQDQVPRYLARRRWPLADIAEGRA